MPETDQVRLIDRRLLLLSAGAALLARGTAFAQSIGPLPRGIAEFKGPPTDFYETKVNGERLIAMVTQASNPQAGILDKGFCRNPKSLSIRQGRPLRALRFDRDHL